VLFIGSGLFTLSDAELKLNDLNTLVGKPTLEQPPLPDSGQARPVPLCPPRTNKNRCSHRNDRAKWRQQPAVNIGCSI